MVVVPAGNFTMGSSEKEKSWAASHGGSLESVADEAPQHNVSVPSFGIGKYDVTRSEYAAFVRETKHPAGDGCYVSSMPKSLKRENASWKSLGFAQTSRDPVVCVTWRDAHAYLEWLNKKAGKKGSGTYRLPSESEWEYAARAGTTSKFWWGDNDAEASAHAWYKDNAGSHTHPVGSKPPNAFGLYDMVGQVWQWTEDCYSENYAAAPSIGAPNEAVSADKSTQDSHGNCMRVDRGSSWLYPAWLLRSATRERNPADFRDVIMGFRVAKTLPSSDISATHGQ
jgi:formylglycine-generating enzyme required for sulfatase activity